MFEHGKSGQTYYSVRDKIKYYTKIINGNIEASLWLKEKAKRRLDELKKINNQEYKEPALIVTDDKHFGNGISKPRLCVVTSEDYKGRLKTYPLNKRTTNILVLPSYPDRQMDKFRLLDRSDVYETKYISNIMPLTNIDREMIKQFYATKKQ